MPALLLLLVLVSFFVPLVAFAQQGMPMAKDGMMCPMCGAGGTVLMGLGALLVLAATAALIALTVFLVRRSQTPRQV